MNFQKIQAEFHTSIFEATNKMQENKSSELIKMATKEQNIINHIDKLSSDRTGLGQNFDARS